MMTLGASQSYSVPLALFSALSFFVGIPIAVLLVFVGIDMMSDRDSIVQALLGIVLVASIPIFIILLFIESIAHIHFTVAGVLGTMALWSLAVAGGSVLGFLVYKARKS